MKTIRIPKSNGKWRVCYDPDPELKRRLRALVPQLNLLAEELDVHHVQHGFTEGRSPVTNARVHIGWQFTLTMDLESFFDSVTLLHVMRAAPGKLGPLQKIDVSECFVDGAARQGLPTSPALANIAASPMDRDIMALCPKGRFVERPMVYTRYADDMAFSSQTMATVELLLQEIPKLAEKHGFKVNAAKTKVQAAVAGRRMVTGVAVGEHDVTIPRELRRRIRAGHHQDTHGLRRRNIKRLLFDRKRWKTRLPLRARFYFQLRGLKEWAKLRLPKDAREQPANPVVRAAARVVTAVCGQNLSNKIFGSFSRKFG